MAMAIVLCLTSSQSLRSIPTNDIEIIETKVAPPSPRNRTGTWIGNTWIPPAGWQYHTPSELRQLYRGKNILWLGDSTGRRTAMNMYALLQWNNSNFLTTELSSPKLIDITKRGSFDCDQWPDAHARPTICRSLDGGGTITFVPLVCHKHVENFFQSADTLNITQDMDLIVVALGIWEVMRPWDCKAPNRTLDNITIAAIHNVHEFERSTKKRVIWRTSGYPDHGSTLTDAVTKLNEMVMDVIDQTTGVDNSQFSYLDWGGAVEPRSKPGERIVGDLKAHYGLEPRLVLIEMITNQLQEEGFFG
ncbi:hypothetical protein FisN_11Lh170 [Fistulifera solaris]|uniref:SGNH hydrolase-type esterase domain-containing protein n=1 Tax=Fistulifera solaris TaxID=1519565 RepID=A0A1Z5J7G3_FISSO|nr:hypothetical protein FisN_11Lh170 [Fistulifera solaris]|eukprot:GAX09852.1 hypothetical protein FisN_11Lh170 [Fistulifera solaris]